MVCQGGLPEFGDFSFLLLIGGAGVEPIIRDARVRFLKDGNCGMIPARCQTCIAAQLNPTELKR